MSFAVVELKYMPKKTFIVRISWIKNYVRNHSPVQEFYCYISTDLAEDPDFSSKYYLKFNGTPGLFKVFVHITTDSIIEAVSYQEQKRLKSVPQKYRQPGNTDAELKAGEKSRKKKQKVVQKAAKESAKLQNMAHLANVLKNVTKSKDVAQITQNNDQTAVQSIEGRIKGALSDVCNAETNTQLGVACDVESHRNEFENAEKLPTESSSAVSNRFFEIVQEAIDCDDFIGLDLDFMNDSHCGATNKDDPQVHNSIEIEDMETAATTPSNAPINNYVLDFAYDMSDEIISTSTAYNDLLPDLHPNIIKLPTLITANPAPLNVLKSIENESAHKTKESPNLITTTNQNHSQQCTDKTSEQTIKIPPASSVTMTNQSNSNKGNSISKSRTCTATTDAVNYKEAYSQLKKENEDLFARNIALQNALVAADKASSKVPEVPFTPKDGGRQYTEGVFLSEIQCKILDATRDPNKYINNLALAIFGRETLMNSSVTGIASKKLANRPAKPALNPLWLQLLYDLTDARTNKSVSKSEINKILNKKISNFIGADKRKTNKITSATSENNGITHDGKISSPDLSQTTEVGQKL